MTKENSDALQNIVETIDYVSTQNMKKATYDVTRNARITKVYYDEGGSVFTIKGYDIEVDGKSYYLKKESGKGIIAEENDIVKLHIPCNNMNYMYLSYSHDPEDFIKYFTSAEGSSYTSSWNSGRKEVILSYDISVTFPATTDQFSSVTVSFPMGLKITRGMPYNFIFTADNGVWGVVTSHDVYGNIDADTTTSVSVKLYNENPSTSAVTKSFNIYLKAMGITN